jgi:hypothetical protein
MSLTGGGLRALQTQSSSAGKPKIVMAAPIPMEKIVMAAQIPMEKIVMAAPIPMEKIVVAAPIDAVAMISVMPMCGVLVGDLADKTLSPGCYTAAAAISLSGILKLDADGLQDAKWTITIDAAFSAAAESQITMINAGTDPAQIVDWVVTGAINLGAGSTAIGSMNAGGAIGAGHTFEALNAGGAISLGAGATCDAGGAIGLGAHGTCGDLDAVGAVVVGAHATCGAIIAGVAATVGAHATCGAIIGSWQQRTTYRPPAHPSQNADVMKFRYLRPLTLFDLRDFSHLYT